MLDNIDKNFYKQSLKHLKYPFHSVHILCLSCSIELVFMYHIINFQVEKIYVIHEMKVDLEHFY